VTKIWNSWAEHPWEHIRFCSIECIADSRNHGETLKQILIALSSGILILTSCMKNEGSTAQELTAPPSPIPTNTNTLIPTMTPTASTPALTPGASVTFLPTIPTFTPTFDVSTIVTVTPAPKVDCPKEDSSIKLTFRPDDHSIDDTQEMLKYLNQGGSIKAILSALPSFYYPGLIRVEDLTGDGIPELAYIHYGPPVSIRFSIFTCLDGEYVLYQNESANQSFSFYGVYDMNLNGIPELVVISRGCTGGGCYRHYILEWNGATYVNLSPEAAVEDVINGGIRDINDDETLELVLRTAPLPFYVYQPWREELHIFSWDGATFFPQPVKGYQPEYRFQTIQDADLESTLGNYDIARNLYRQAIFNDSLEWWSSERYEYENAMVQARWTHEPTPFTKPVEDKTEYSRLAAYAYYRILLLQLVQGDQSAANTTYEALQHKFGGDTYGHTYMEMTTAFWEAYQSSHIMYDGCAAAIQYAAEHPEILVPLGSDYHGSQSHTYVPADVCPFR
jgi:hypothetical protein